MDVGGRSGGPKCLRDIPPEARCRRPLYDCSQMARPPYVAVDFMTRVTGEFLHPDLVNFDILAKQNYEYFKAR